MRYFAIECERGREVADRSRIAQQTECVGGVSGNSGVVVPEQDAKLRQTRSSSLLANLPDCQSRRGTKWTPAGCESAIHERRVELPCVSHCEKSRVEIYLPPPDLVRRSLPSRTG